MNKIDLTPRVALRNVTSFEADYYLWCMEQAALVRAGHFDALDRENLAEEIESLARSDKKEIRKRLEILLRHLLKWEFQPRKRKHGWLATIAEQRLQLADLLKESPSLRDFPVEALPRTYELAKLKARAETSLAEKQFPVQPPYGIDDILSEEFLPGEPWDPADD